MNKNYLKFLLKDRISSTLIIFFICFMLSPLTILDKYNDEIFGTATLTMITFAFILPLFNSKIFQKKRSSDLYFSMPVSKKELIITRSVFGYFQLIASWTLSYLFLILIVISKYAYLNVVHFLFYFLFMILTGTAIFSFSSFVCIKSTASNRAFTTILQAIILNLLIAAIINRIGIRLNSRVIINNITYHTNIFFSSNFATIYFQKLLLNKEYRYGYAHIYITAIILILTCSLFIFLIFKNAGKYRVEDAEKTKETLGYSILNISIPALFFGLLSKYIFSDSILAILILFTGLFAFFFPYFLCMGRIKFNKYVLKDLIIMLACSFVLGLIFEFTLF